MTLGVGQAGRVFIQQEVHEGVLQEGRARQWGHILHDISSHAPSAPAASQNLQNVQHTPPPSPPPGGRSRGRDRGRDWSVVIRTPNVAAGPRGATAPSPSTTNTWTSTANEPVTNAETNHHTRDSSNLPLQHWISFILLPVTGIKVDRNKSSSYRSIISNHFHVLQSCSSIQPRDFW